MPEQLSALNSREFFLILTERMPPLLKNHRDVPPEEYRDGAAEEYRDGAAETLPEQLSALNSREFFLILAERMPLSPE
ncbi:MAG TPA: hypothetical protein VII97_13295, partial [Anaerolineales bacterium]